MSSVTTVTEKLGYLAKLVEMQPNTNLNEEIATFFSDPRVTAITSLEQLCDAVGATYKTFVPSQNGTPAHYEIEPHWKNFTPTEYQLNFFKVVSLPYIYTDLPVFNIRMVAVAGSGKSTCIFKSMFLLPANLKIGLSCFNKRIAEEWNDKLVKLGLSNRVTCKTLHSYGYALLKRNIRSHYLRLEYGGDRLRSATKLELDNDKLMHYLNKDAESWDLKELSQIEDFDMGEYRRNIRRLISLSRCYLTSKVRGIASIAAKFQMDIYHDEINIAHRVITAMSRTTAVIDFDEMLWMPTLLEQISIKKTQIAWTAQKFDIMFVDECQDLSKAQLKIALKHVSKDGRLVSVGDPKQRITGFAGADRESWDALGNVGKCIDMPLTLSFRCPGFTTQLPEIKEHVPYFEVLETAKPGTHRKKSYFSEVKDSDLIICRNTAPLITACLHYIKQNQKAIVLGTDIAKGIIAFVRKYSKRTRDVDTMLQRMWKVYDEKLASIAKEKGMTLDEASETTAAVNLLMKIDCVNALSMQCDTPNCIEQKVKQIFSNEVSEGVTLMTGHKCKGLESDNVFILDEYLCKKAKGRARTDEQAEEEKNLVYVMKTRHKEMLSYLELDDIV